MECHSPQSFVDEIRGISVAECRGVQAPETILLQPVPWKTLICCDHASQKSINTSEEVQEFF